MKMLREEGASPVTFAPENSSYLEEDEHLDIDDLDLTDAVIDEPDLSAESIEEPATEEPSLDDVNDLDIDMGGFDDVAIADYEPTAEETTEEETLSDTDLDIDIDLPPTDAEPPLEEEALAEDNLEMPAGEDETQSLEEEPVSADELSSDNDLSFDDSFIDDDLSLDDDDLSAIEPPVEETAEEAFADDNLEMPVEDLWKKNLSQPKICLLILIFLLMIHLTICL